jgi:hypothetical protein
VLRPGDPFPCFLAGLESRRINYTARDAAQQNGSLLTLDFSFPALLREHHVHELAIAQLTGVNPQNAA